MFLCLCVSHACERLLSALSFSDRCWPSNQLHEDGISKRSEYIEYTQTRTCAANRFSKVPLGSSDSMSLCKCRVSLEPNIVGTGWPQFGDQHSMCLRSDAFPPCASVHTQNNSKQAKATLSSATLRCVPTLDGWVVGWIDDVKQASQVRTRVPASRLLGCR
jgi:hypothetical protein